MESIQNLRQHNNGTKAKISRAAQLSLSINGVLQQPPTSPGWIWY